MANVLIVDDSRLSVMALQNMLARLGHTVVDYALNGAEALKKFQERNPDVVTLDLVMPDIDGVQVCKSINSLNPNAKIIMITSEKFPEEKKEGLIVHHYIQKPITMKKLEEAFQNV